MSLMDYDFDRHTIQDPIHGAITFGYVEKRLVDHRLFQRLHGLRQNSLLHLVFPAANHTRFDHSLGVMRMSGTFFDAVLKNQERICEAGASRSVWQDLYRVDGPEIRETIKILSRNSYYKLILRIAALFHDIGHGPFSHLFDKFFPSAEYTIKLINEKEYEHVKERLLLLGPEKLVAPIEHEILSCIIATRILHDTASEFQKYGFDVSVVVRDVCAIIDADIQPSTRLTALPYEVQGVFHDMLSGDIDIDRMDYLLRDSHMCGVNYGIYDPDRILKSMCAYSMVNKKQLRIGMRYSGLGALEDLLLARYQMYAQIYDHKTNRACNAMLECIRERLAASGWTWYEGCTSIADLLKVFVDFDDRAFINALLRPEIDHGAGKVKELAEKLFLERRLVKRVFEEKADCSADCSEDVKERTAQIRSRYEEHKKRLKESDIWAAEDEFKNKGPKVRRDGYPLKMLRKHPTSGYYMVHEIKDGGFKFQVQRVNDGAGAHRLPEAWQSRDICVGAC